MSEKGADPNKPKDDASRAFPDADAKKELHCSFCGKSQHEVSKLIAGPTVFICNECARLCFDIITQEEKLDILKKGERGPTPEHLKHKLDESVAGHDHAKTVVSVAIYNHYQRILSKSAASQGVRRPKSNVLLIGPSGSGKTALAQRLAEIMDVPFVIADAVTLTEAGYVGEDVENLVLRLVQAAGYNVERAQNGIIYIDGIDMIARTPESPVVPRDISGAGVQQALLRIIEGTIVSVPGPNMTRAAVNQFLQVDTSEILFICGGTFNGLGRQSSATTADQDASGGTSTGVESADPVSRRPHPAQLVAYGLIPELVGRLPIVATLDDVDEKLLGLILTQPKNSILQQYRSLFERHAVQLVIDNDAIGAIVKKAFKDGNGARSLQTVFEELLLEAMFYLPGAKDVVQTKITKDVVKGIARPLFVSLDGSERPVPPSG